MVTKPSTEQTQDFSIHNEDFPALPGPNYKDPTLNSDDSKTVSVSDWWLYSGCFSSRLQIKEKTNDHTFTFFKTFYFLLFRTWTPQARAHPMQMGPSSPETRRPQHRTTTRRKGSRCCPMVRPLSQSYRSNSTETSLLNRTTWVRQLGSLPCILGLDNYWIRDIEETKTLCLLWYRPSLNPYVHLSVTITY